MKVLNNSKLSSLITVFLISIFVLGIFSIPVLGSTTQSVNPSDYNGSYKVHVGDSNRYDVVTVQNGSANYISSALMSANGTIVPFKLTKGVYDIIKVVALNTSTTGLPQVYITVSTFIPNHKPIISGSRIGFSIINPAFDSFTDAESYYNLTYSNYYTNVTFDKNRDLISTSVNFGNFVIFSSFDWKTGWLQNERSLNTFSNGTTRFEYTLQRHSDNLVSTFVNYSFTALVAGSIFLIIAIPILIGLSYRSYSKKSKISAHHHSFSTFFKNELHYSKKDANKRSNHTADKALETIESILNETKENTK